MNLPMLLWNQRLKSARKAKGLSASALARKIVGNDDPGAIATMTERIYSYEKISKGKRPVEQPRGQMMTQLADALDVTIEWLRDGDTTAKNTAGQGAMLGLDEIPGTANVIGNKQPIKYPRQTLPIFGRAAGGREGKFILNGERVGEILRPPSVEAVADAYCVEASGDSMHPAIKNGNKLIVNPSRPYRRGDYVVVQITTDIEGIFDGYAKEFVSFNRKELVLKQLNPPSGHSDVMRFPSDKVASVHKIVNIDLD